MKILLMVPPYIDKKDYPGSRFDLNIEDLGLGSISSYLKANGYPDTVIMHCPLEDISCEMLVPAIDSIKPDIVGISISFESTDYLGGIEAAKIIKKNFPYVKVVAGGHAATFLYDKLLEECEYIDYITFGEGEVTTLDLINKLEKNESIDSVAGIAYKHLGEIIVNPKRELIAELDGLPFADRSIYKKHVPEFALIESSRGCWGKCRFCSVPAFFNHGKGKVWRSRSAESIVEEIESIINVWHIHKFDFVDDNFLGVGNIGKGKIDRFCELIKERQLKIEFHIACRVESVSLEELMSLKEVGLKKVYVGIESGSDTTLKRYGKNVTKEDNRRAIQILKELGIDAKLCLIIFDPWMTPEELSETVEFLIQMDCFSLLHWTSILNSYKPYIGTEMQKQLFNEYRILDHGIHFSYEISDEKTREIKNICRFVSGSIKYLFEAVKELNDISERFIGLDSKLSKPLLYFLRFLLAQNTKDLKNNDYYIDVFYRLLTIMAKRELGADVFERIAETKAGHLQYTANMGNSTF